MPSRALRVPDRDCGHGILRVRLIDCLERPALSVWPIDGELRRCIGDKFYRG